MASDHMSTFYVVGPDIRSSSDTEFYRGGACRLRRCPHLSDVRSLSGNEALDGASTGTDRVPRAHTRRFAFAGSAQFLISDRAKEAIEGANLDGLTVIEEVEITSTLGEAS